MLPRRRRLKVTPAQAMKNREVMKKKLGGAVSAVKNYGKNVVGGAKIVGGAIKKGIVKGANFLAKPLVREFKMQDEADRVNRVKGRELNREYSGKLSDKETLDILRRGMKGKKK